MDLSQIKNLVKQNGDKFIMVENGEPEFVVMSFREYEKLSHTDSRMPRHISNAAERRGYLVETADLGGEIVQETEFEVAEQSLGSGVPVRLEDIRLEDLPI